MLPFQCEKQGSAHDDAHNRARWQKTSEKSTMESQTVCCVETRICILCNSRDSTFFKTSCRTYMRTLTQTEFGFSFRSPEGSFFATCECIAQDIRFRDGPDVSFGKTSRRLRPWYECCLQLDKTIRTPGHNSREREIAGTTHARREKKTGFHRISVLFVARVTFLYDCST